MRPRPFSSAVLLVAVRAVRAALAVLAVLATLLWAAGRGVAEPPASPAASELPEPRPPTEAVGQPPWKKVKELDQVIVERADSTLDRKPWSRGTTLLDAPLAVVARHLLDFASLPRYAPKIVAVRIVEQGADHAVVYYRLDLPWPLSDRHWTVAYRWRLDDQHFQMAWTDANDRQPSDVKKAVLVEIARGGWVLDSDGPNRTRALVVQLVSLGGSWLPRSVIEETVWKQPLETFRGIRRALSEAKNPN